MSGGFLINTKKEANTKLTTEMCSQTFDWKSSAPSSGHVWQQPILQQACGPAYCEFT